MCFQNNVFLTPIKALEFMQFLCLGKDKYKRKHLRKNNKNNNPLQLLQTVCVQFAASGHLTWRWIYTWSDGGRGNVKFDKKWNDLFQLITIISLVYNRTESLTFSNGSVAA